ncbi:putative defensin, plant [Rosa chinensis]|uniref:Putative defensin, plant n=1 Tax=Rosa chinensis TaxID=74649 RepID=A0A2P6R4I0_ROSCH|nr:defensin Ec-AMP-D1 [Rosa chinensis]PRQ41335.1 putative defensin, plant [Rosa chinensis]
MESFMRVFSTFFVALLLLVASAGIGPNVMVAEARTCESQSLKYEGMCLRESHCASVCQTEGYSGGDCHGLYSICVCTKDCQ